MVNIKGYDITAANYNRRPVMDYVALYGTGTPDIKATDQMLADNPHAILIDQSPVVTAVNTALDDFDCERGALTVDELPDVIREARANRISRVRKGQRFPLVYASLDLMDGITGTLDSAKLQGACGLHLAHWGIGANQAALLIGTDINGYVIKAVQYANAGAYDLDIFSLEWIGTSGQWNESWTSHGQQWTLDELASKEGITVPGLIPGNAQAIHIKNLWTAGERNALIPLKAHFTFVKYPRVP